MVCSPRAAGWFDDAVWPAWEQLGFQHPPDAWRAQEQHEAMCAALAEAGAEVVQMDGAGKDVGGTLDAVYVHDASLVTDWGAIILRMGKP
ncbi:MAG TPA: hypothetical protein VNL38_00855, partial [Candidatus Nitrosotenuis sp.]|nr:hypothetical protein [Candidatus Nitrosotenuis sp.]